MVAIDTMVGAKRNSGGRLISNGGHKWPYDINGTFAWPGLYVWFRLFTKWKTILLIDFLPNDKRYNAALGRPSQDFLLHKMDS